MKKETDMAVHCIGQGEDHPAAEAAQPLRGTVVSSPTGAGRPNHGDCFPALDLGRCRRCPQTMLRGTGSRAIPRLRARCET